MTVTIAAGRIDNGALREAFLASGLTAGAVADLLGWTYRRGHRARNDGSRVRRALGLKLERGRSGEEWRLRRTVSSETALLLADALGVDPVEIGL